MFAHGPGDPFGPVQEPTIPRISIAVNSAIGSNQPERQPATYGCGCLRSVAAGLLRKRRVW